MSEKSEQPEVETRSVRGVYGISVAAELSGFGVAALRLYEDYGLITPGRTAGGTRRYSDHDLARLKRIAELIDAGVNLVGIGRVLDLETRTGDLERDNRRLEADNAQLRAEHTASGAEDDTAHTASTDEAAAQPETGRVGRRRRPAAGQRTRLRDAPSRERATGDHN